MTEIDPNLSRLYREASREGPPAAVDAAILAAARKRAAEPERRGRSLPSGRSRSFWSRWMVPASVVATLALGVSIALLVEREHPEIIDDTAIRPAPPRPQRQEPAPATESTKERAADRAAPGAAAKKEAPAAAAPPQPPAVTSPVPIAPTQSPAATSPEPIAPTQAPAASLPAPARAQVPRPDEPAPSAAEAFPTEGRAKASAPNAAAPQVETNSNTASDSATAGPGTAAPAARAATGKLAPMRQQAFQRSAQTWLDEISRLKREGRDKEAAEQLDEFRKAYPAHAVPEELLQ